VRYLNRPASYTTIISEETACDHTVISKMTNKMISPALLSRGPGQLYLACQDWFAGDLKPLQKQDHMAQKSSTLRKDTYTWTDHLPIGGPGEDGSLGVDSQKKWEYMMSTTHSSRTVITLVVTCLGTFMVLLDTTIVATALPTIQSSLHAQLSDLQWAVDAYTLPFAALMLTGGTLGDRFGRKRFFLLGLNLFVIGSAFCGFASTLGWLLFGRAVQGVGAAALAPGSLSVLVAAFPEPRARTQAIGLWAGISGLGLAAGPLAGGLLIQIASWPAIFFVNLPIGVVVLALSLPRLSESRNPNARRIDLPGQVLVTGALVCLVMALNEGPSQGWASPLILSLFIGSAACLVAFLLVEARVREPMLPLGLFGNSAFSVTNLASLVLGATMIGAIFFLTQFFQQVQGYTALEASLRTLPVTLAIFVAAPLAGPLTARVGARLPIVLGALLCAATLFLEATFVEPDVSYSTIWWHYPLFGIGAGFMLTALASAVLATTPTNRSGLGSAVLNTTRQIGIALGIAILGAVVLNQLPGNITSQLTGRGAPGPISATIANKIAAAGGGASQAPLSGHLPFPPAELHQAVNQAVVDSFHVAWLILAIALLVTAVLVAFLVRPKQPATRTSVESVGLGEATEARATQDAVEEEVTR
jgi:EmrB/QacA subfamily drug resistance transporter